MIRFEKVKFSYRTEQRKETSSILEEVSFQIRKGEIVGICGSNGSGKSTTALLSAGILIPQGGDIFVDEINTRTFNPEIQRKVGLIFQFPEHQIVGITVEEDLAFGLENLGVERSKMIDRIQFFSQKFGLTEYLKKPVSYLSGGFQQKLAIASVLCMEPDFIIFDEPTSQLDPWFQREFWNILLKIHAEFGLGIIVISQRTFDLEKTPRLIIIKDKRIAFDGESEKAWQIPEIEDWGVAIPESVIVRDLRQKIEASSICPIRLGNK
ncbi:MAG: ATP-binding cassette domain-containing protein [Candidatus Riflebacteria bacterium]|nr:ATP-binding cassette domain-containing protein [Candidatus Riflebacteria bacterium]